MSWRDSVCNFYSTPVIAFALTMDRRATTNMFFFAALTSKSRVRIIQSLRESFHLEQPEKWSNLPKFACHRLMFVPG